jgi:hypothetical protein
MIQSGGRWVPPSVLYDDNSAPSEWAERCASSKVRPTLDCPIRVSQHRQADGDLFRALA